MIKYAEVEDGDAAILVVYKLFYFTTLVLACPLEIAILHFLLHGQAL